MRYLPHTAADRAAMLAVIGADSVDALFADVPESARLDGPVHDLPLHQSEMAVERHMVALANRNLTAGSVPFFCGAGVYRHHIPASVDMLIQRGEFLTSYTPYQPEATQGTLQMLFEFQTQVALLTGMEVANASMYDGSTACAEAVLMANRVTGRARAILCSGLHPHYVDVINTHARLTGFNTFSPHHDDISGMVDADALEILDEQTSCVVVQTPNIFGEVVDVTELAKACHAKGALLIVVVTEIVSLGLLPSPGSMGADIVVAEGQSIGNPMGFGGPHIGLFATRQKFIRQMPGRLCGETVDAEGRRGFVLTLSTREQHIRREKATSNICTNAGLCALAFSIHLSLLGETGLKHLARLNHAKAVQAAERLSRIEGVTLRNESFFNEFCLELPLNAVQLVEWLVPHGILAGVPVSRLLPDAADMAGLLLVAVTETTSDADIEALADALQRTLEMARQREQEITR